MRKDLIRSLFVLVFVTGWGILSSCVVRYPVVGKFLNTGEVFRGRIKAQSDHQKGSMDISGEVSGVKCVGRSNMAIAPPGRDGRIALACQDGKRILANYRVLSWGKGHGKGSDQGGNLFVFTFGMPDDEAGQYFRESQP